jgi:hypothetical protein
MYLAPWPTPSSRLYKVDLLEGVSNLTKKYKGNLYTLRSTCPTAKRCGCEAFPRGSPRGLILLKVSAP